MGFAGPRGEGFRCQRKREEGTRSLRALPYPAIWGTPPLPCRISLVLWRPGLLVPDRVSFSDSLSSITKLYRTPPCPLPSTLFTIHCRLQNRPCSTTFVILNRSRDYAPNSMISFPTKTPLGR